MRKILASVLLFTAVIVFSYSQDKMVIAVSPFENLSGKNSENYIGFQISEYMASALASINNVTVVERGLLEKVLNEQNLQISGMTEDKDAVNLGNLLNAKQMLIGSYTVTRSKINVKGRIVDVETAAVTASANVSGSFSDDINPVMYDFFYALLDKNPPAEVFSQMSVLEQRISKLEAEKNDSFAKEIGELQEQLANLGSRGDSLEDTISSLKISLAVEAQLSMLKDMDQTSSIDAAKALEASFASNDEKALEYLQRAIADPTKSYLSYGLSADSYYEKLSAVEGESFFVKMVKNQLEVNKILSKDAEAISKYRNTLKLLVNRLYSVLHPDMFTLNVGMSEQIEMGTVSAIITLPSNISIDVNEGTRSLLNRVLGTQDIIGTNGRSDTGDLVFKTDPPVLKKLLPNSGIKQLFPIGLNAGVGYSIQFVDKNENVLFELVHDNVGSFNLETGLATTWGKNSDTSYNVKEAKDGWSFRNSKVEVQARELKNLHGVKVVLDRRSFTMDYSFPMYSDTKWKSVLLHAYRQKYIKIALDDVEDPMPQVKDILVTHSVFSVGDYLEGIPLLVDPDYVAGIADLTAVVYWGDSSNTVVTGEWSGVKNYSSENISGELNPNSILYFSMPAVMKSGQGNFIVENNGQKKRISFNSVIGLSWVNYSFGRKKIQVVGSKIFTNYHDGWTHIVALDTYTGEYLWKYNIRNPNDFQVLNRKIYVSNGDREDYVACLEVSSREVIWKTNIGGYKLKLYDGRVYIVGGRFGGPEDVACIDMYTGKILWKNSRVRSELNIQVIDSKIFFINMHYKKTAVCLDAVTGDLVWEFESDRGFNVENINVSGNRVFVGVSDWQTVCLDAFTGEVLWKKEIASDQLIIENNFVYIAYPHYTACLDTQTGRTIWKNIDIYSNSLQIVGDLIYSAYTNESASYKGYLACLDKKTGKLLWKNSIIQSEILSLAESRLFTLPYIHQDKNGQINCLDISVIESSYQFEKSGNIFYNNDNYSRALTQYSKAVIEEGSIDGVLLYRYAYSKEQLDGLTSDVKNKYFKAWVRLKEQYPGHRYVASAEGKME